MRIFGSSHECYIPDTQILYPLVFLNDVVTLSCPNSCYKECIDALRKDFVLKILPENDYEFYRLILRKFSRFLDDVKKQVFVAKSKGLNPESFQKNITSLINFGDYGDFNVYWDQHRSKFVKWLQTDDLAIGNEVNSIIAETLLKYKEYTEPFKHNWTEKDKETVSTIYEALKLERKNGVLVTRAHDEDLNLLAGCLLYACGYRQENVWGYLPEGILYLITNDKDLYDCGKKVKTLESLCGGAGKKLTGFDVIKPEDFLRQLKKYNLG